MRIPICYIPKTKFKKFIVFEKKFRTKKLLVPIGCDCHPAHMLQAYNIRKYSLPFDWLNTEPKKGLDFITSNLDNNFSDFLCDLYKNERGFVVSKKYSFSEFMHEPNLIESEQVKEKFKRRISRFLYFFKSKDMMFLFNISSTDFSTEAEINNFIQSIKEFIKRIKRTDSLHIYLRYDENLNENKDLNHLFVSKIPSDDRIYFAEYIRYKDKDGIWGNSTLYKTLFKNLNIDLYLTFPKIYMK